jgi:hypothetical protein
MTIRFLEDIFVRIKWGVRVFYVGIGFSEWCLSVDVMTFGDARRRVALTSHAPDCATGALCNLQLEEPHYGTQEL